MNLEAKRLQATVSTLIFDYRIRCYRCQGRLLPYEISVTRGHIFFGERCARWRSRFHATSKNPAARSGPPWRITTRGGLLERNEWYENRRVVFLGCKQIALNYAKYGRSRFIEDVALLTVRRRTCTLFVYVIWIFGFMEINCWFLILLKRIINRQILF